MSVLRSRPARAGTAGRGRRHPRRPVLPRPLLRRSRPLLAPGRTDPRPRHAPGRPAAGEPADSRRVHHRPDRRGHPHRRPTRRLPRQRPALRRAHRVPGAGRRHCGPDPPPHRTRPARRRPATTRSRSPCTCARPGRWCPPASTSSPRSSTAPPPRRPERWTSCAGSPAACTAAILAQGGLRSAFAMLARRRSPVPVELDVRVPHRLPEQVEVASAFYIVAEALTNAVNARHRLRHQRRRRPQLRRDGPAPHRPRQRHRRGELDQGYRVDRSEGPCRGPGRPPLPRQPASHWNRPARGTAAGPCDEPVATPEPVPRDRRRGMSAPRSVDYQPARPGQLITGQLAVPLDNAQLYAELAASRARIVAAADIACRRHRTRTARRTAG